MTSNWTEEEVREMLSYIPCHSLTYQEWINVGMALKDGGYPLSLWDEWSATDPERYDDFACFRHWQSFESSGTTMGTLVHMAKQGGYEHINDYNISGVGINEDGSLDWNAKIHFEEKPIIDKHYLQKEEIREPKDSWDQIDEIITYLSTLFDPAEYVGYVMTSQIKEQRDGSIKYIPDSKGVYTKTAGEIIEELRDTRDISKGLGSYDDRAGAWIRFNPLDGNGVTDSCVTDYRYTLIESDEGPIDEQVAMLEALRLPIAVMVHSGSKSVHAIVRVDAPSLTIYKERVNYIYGVCKREGFRIDENNRNASRLSRLPGVYRNNHKQWIVKRNIGFATYEEWEKWEEAQTVRLPDPVSVGDYWDTRPEQDPEIISGVLRRGRKMVIAGASKVGKTTLATQLALAIANGWSWLGIPCVKGKVLYINFEVAEQTFNEKLEGICKKKSVDIHEVGKNLHVLHLRGFDFGNPDKLTSDIISKFKDSGYSIMIIDPIYKMMDGDENNSEANRNMTHRFDMIATACRTSIVYIHHFSKGSQTAKSTLDRMSGHAIQGRDTDAGISIMELDSPEDGRRAVQVEFELRDFKDPKPIRAWFDYPVHTVDDLHILDDARYMDDVRGKKKSEEESLLEWAEKLHFGFNLLTQDKEVKEISQPEMIRWMNSDAPAKNKKEADSQRVSFVNRFKEVQKRGYTYLAKESSKNKKTGEAATIYLDKDLWEAYKE